MMIDLWRHGSVMANGREIVGDIMVVHGKIFKWEYKTPSHHTISPVDLQPLMDANPHKIIIGMGDLGKVSLSLEAEQMMREKGTHLVLEITPDAIELINEEKIDFAALIHVTC